MEDRMRIEDKKEDRRRRDRREGRKTRWEGAGPARGLPYRPFSLRPSSKKTTGVRHISHYVLYPAVWLYVWLVLDCRCRSTG